MRVPSIVGATSAIVLAAALACGPKPSSNIDPSVPPPWAVLWPLGEPIDTVVVALLEPVDFGHATTPENDSERLVFSQLSKGDYGIDVSDSFVDGSIVLTPVDSSWPALRFVDARGVDPRDLLDPLAGIDLIVLHDRTTADYAVSLGRFGDVPLAPARGHFLVAASRVAAFERGDSLPALPGIMTSRLALDAVRTAYAHAIPIVEWKQSLGQCDDVAGADSAAPISTTRHILYDATDATARDLADRIASLANDSSSSKVIARSVPGISEAPRIVSVGAGPREFAMRLTNGGDFAYVVGTSYYDIDNCQAVAYFLNAAPWLAGARAPRDVLIPLVKTRSIAFALRRSEGFGFDIRPDREGGLRIVSVTQGETP